MSGCGDAHDPILASPGLVSNTRWAANLARVNTPTPTDLLALTAALVDMPSVSFQEGPFVDWLESELSGLEHLEVSRVGDNLVARTNMGHEQRIILAGHTDTVPVNNNAKARIEGDVLWGLGSTDMKGGLAVFLELARRVTQPTVDVTYIFYAREEVSRSHSGLAELAEARPDLVLGDCAILGEPTEAVIEAGCQGTLRFEITLAGAAAHTARPWMGRNAIHRMADLLATLAAYQPRTPILDGCEYRESVQAVGVEGGTAGNVVPASAKLVVSHRFAPDRSAAQAEEWFREYVAQHIEEGDTVERVDGSPACPPSLGHPLLAKLMNDNGLLMRAKLGWTDVAQFAEFGIPATNFGPGNPTIAHTRDEHCDRASIEAAYSALRNLISG